MSLLFLLFAFALHQQFVDSKGKLAELKSQINLVDLHDGVQAAGQNFLAQRQSVSPNQMQLASVSVTNNCVLPVYFFEAGTLKIAPGQTVLFNSANPISLSNGRVSFSYSNIDISEYISAIELGAGFSALNQPTQRYNFNLIQQSGFSGLNLEMVLWADAIGGNLLCEDARVKTTYSMAQCLMPDQSTQVLNVSTPDNLQFQRCANNGGLSSRSSCTSDYALYVNANSLLFNKTSGRWQQSARSVGYSTKGFVGASYADGTTLPSTFTGRDGNRVAVNFECFEAPCLNINAPGAPADPTCLANGQVSVGNSGFNLCADVTTSILNIAVMQLNLCPVTSVPTVFLAQKGPRGSLNPY